MQTDVRQAGGVGCLEKKLHYNAICGIIIMFYKRNKDIQRRNE